MRQYPRSLDEITQGMTVGEKIKVVTTINQIAYARATAPVTPPPRLAELRTSTETLPESHPEKVKASREIERFVNSHTLEQLTFWLFGGRLSVPGLDAEVMHPGLVFTVDEHDTLMPVKRLPRRQYFKPLLEMWIHNQIVAVPKSRQIMITWFFCSIAAWMVLQPYKNIAIVCKEANGSDKLIGRVEHILRSLPPGCTPPPWGFKGLRRIEGSLSCFTTQSRIEGLKENAEKQMRQNTYTWIFSDESAFQEGFMEQYEAALPTIRGGGRYTMVSTPDGEEQFFALITDDSAIALPMGA